MNPQRCNDLRLTGSGGANRVMEAELKRLVMRSPFDVRLDKPKREGEETLLYPFDARVAWVAACHHRTSSRISWDLCSSEAVRLEPLVPDLDRPVRLPGRDRDDHGDQPQRRRLGPRDHRRGAGLEPDVPRRSVRRVHRHRLRALNATSRVQVPRRASSE